MSVFGDPLLSRLASPFEAANDAKESTSRPTPRVFIKSFGCQMNVYDSQRMADLAIREGYTETQTIADADLVVLNTCHIRERASEKVFSELGMIRELKERRAAAGLETTLVVAGCVAQAEGQEILRRQPAVDIVVGPQNYHRLPKLLKTARRCGYRVSARGQVRSSSAQSAGGRPRPRRERLRHGAGRL